MDLMASVDGDGKLSPEDQRWLGDGLRQYIDDEEVSLEQALSLNGAPGQRKAKTLIKESIRNKYLLEAWNLVTDERVSPRQRSEMLHDKMSRFETSSYRIYKQHESPPERLAPLQKLLFRIYKAGAQLPGTGHGLHKLVMRILGNH